MKRKSFVIAIVLAIIVLIGLSILDNNPITNNKFCLGDNDCKIHHIGGCCDFITVNSFHNQINQENQITCTEVCPEYEAQCIDFRCELKKIPIFF